MTRRLAYCFASSNFNDFDLLLDILFIKDLTQTGEISREIFKDFILSDLKVTGVTEKDIDVLLKTH